MSYAHILVEVADSAEAMRRADAAAVLAAHFGARLTGVVAQCPAPLEVDPHATIGMIAEELDQRRARARRAIADTEALFRSVAARHLDDLAIHGCLEPATDSFIRQSRAADLIVIGQNGPAEIAAGAPDAEALLETCGRPVLVMPAARVLAAPPANVVVIWSDARESRRAVLDAMPLLASASEVTVVRICEEANGAEARLSVADAARYLARHGVNARSLVLHDSGRAVAVRLEEFAFNAGADLVVAGGYGRHRLVATELVANTRKMLLSYRTPCVVSV